MKKPSVYFDTSIISAYWYEGADIAMISRRLRTREWWDAERENFALRASRFTEAELEAGVFPKQPECLKMVRRMHYLTATAAVREFIEEIMQAHVVPEKKRADAGHLAISAVHEIDYLLTWNYAHMANPVSQEQLAELCDKAGLIVPLMVSPESVPQVRFGQSIRREA